jgi:protein TonB
MKHHRHRDRLIHAAILAVAAFIAGCTAPPTATTTVVPVVTAARPPAPAQISVADTPLAYRHDAAAHLYGKNSDRIFKGIMPPFLYAIGVIQLEVDEHGQLTSLTWMREPVHAPEVVAEIERTVRQAAPFPAPVKLGRATYIETWLWDVSGRFQLHTLTEGQSWDVSHAGKQVPPGTETVSGLGQVPDLTTK